MRRALVLSGGGAKGSWQVGACQYLIVERGLWFDVIAGVSAGAVNAATLAQARDPDELAAELEHLRAVWLGLRGSRDVYRRRWLGALGTVLARRASLYNAAPMRWPRWPSAAPPATSPMTCGCSRPTSRSPSPGGPTTTGCGWRSAPSRC